MRAAVRRRGGGGAEDQGGRAGGDGADRFRRRGSEQVPREDRVGSREAGRPQGRSTRRRAGFPGPPSGGEAVGGGEGDGGGAPGTGDPDDRGSATLVAGDADANLRRARGAPARTGPRDRRTPRRDGTGGEVDRPRRHLRPRSARPWSDAQGVALARRPGVIAFARWRDRREDGHVESEVPRLRAGDPGDHPARPHRRRGNDLPVRAGSVARYRSGSPARAAPRDLGVEARPGGRSAEGGPDGAARPFRPIACGGAGGAETRRPRRRRKNSTAPWTGSGRSSGPEGSSPGPSPERSAGADSPSFPRHFFAGFPSRNEWQETHAPFAALCSFMSLWHSRHRSRPEMAQVWGLWQSVHAASG